MSTHENEIYEENKKTVLEDKETDALYVDDCIIDDCIIDGCIREIINRVDTIKGPKTIDEYWKMKEDEALRTYYILFSVFTAAIILTLVLLKIGGIL